MELTVAMIKSLNKSLWCHINILSTSLLLPSFDLEFEFVLRDLHVIAEVAVDIICFKNNPGQGIGEIKARTTEGRDFLSFHSTITLEHQQLYQLLYLKKLTECWLPKITREFTSLGFQTTFLVIYGVIKRNRKNKHTRRYNS